MGRRKKGDKINGWVNLDKPAGLTSTQALGKLRRILNAQKAGHAGTLDPLATGILPIALGEATKTIPFVQDATKIYSFTVKWGKATDTEDSEGDVIAKSEARPDLEAVQSTLPQFIGEIEQIPPKFSAIKIDGQRAYDLARDGQDIEMKSRIVDIKSLEILELRDDDADFRVTCGKGTYVRSLARDIAIALGTYGHITMLRRERVGYFSLENTISLDFLAEIDDKATLEKYVLPLETPLDDIPALPILEKEALHIRNGQKLAFTSKPDYDRLVSAGLDENKEPITALAVLNGKALGLLEVTGPYAQPIRIFNV